jgi:murein DD-endopeptidase MepM/ murein hydrolase activator NlpD
MDGVVTSHADRKPVGRSRHAWLLVRCWARLGWVLRKLGCSVLLPSILLILIAPLCRAQARHGWKVTYQPAALVNGAPVLFRVTAPRPLRSLQAKWLGHQVAFRRSAACKCWYAIAGVALSAKPGTYTLKLDGTTGSGAPTRFSQTVRITAARYPTTKLTVAPQFVEPPKETLVRIEKEQVVKKDVFAESAADALWLGGFQQPAAASVSGVFGSARVFNGEKRSQHQGLDFRVPSGTPIHAANAGKIILARNLYFEGNCVVIDHGQGLMTLYLHLSEFKVKEGDQVEKGQLIGLSGGTGRATAPHLHFAVRWQGVYLNPATLLKLSPP